MWASGSSTASSPVTNYNDCYFSSSQQQQQQHYSAALGGGNGHHRGVVVCLVCGHASAKFNLGAMACNACAAFFRRTLVLNRKYICQCNSSVQNAAGGKTALGRAKSVRHCKHCRLEKCFQVGMKEKAIRSIDVWKLRRELAKKKASVTENITQKIKEEMNNTTDEEEEKDMATEDQQRQDDSARAKKNESSETTLALMCEPRVSSLRPQLDHPVHLLASLLHVEQNLTLVRNSSRQLPKVFERYETVNELTGAPENLLAMADYFLVNNDATKKNRSRWDMKIHMEKFEKKGIWFATPDQYIRDMLTSIGFAKTLPVYAHLSFADQMALLNSMALPAIDLFLSFYSLSMGATVLVMPNGKPIIEMFQIPRYQNDPTVRNLTKKIYCDTMLQFTAVAPSTEEFIFLLALLYLNSAVSGLSSEAQTLLSQESEKYARALMQIQQMKFGEAKGAMRFAELLRLIWASMANAQRHRELLVYLDLVHDVGQFEQVMPKAFVPLCTQGSVEMSMEL